MKMLNKVKTDQQQKTMDMEVLEFWSRRKDCHFGAIGKMSGCITTEKAALHSGVVGGADEKIRKSKF